MLHEIMPGVDGSKRYTAHCETELVSLICFVTFYDFNYQAAQIIIAVPRTGENGR